MNRQTIFHIDLKMKLIMVLAFGIIYGWIAPKLFAPHRYDSSAFPIFVITYIVSLAGAVIFTLGRKPTRHEIAALIVVLLAWTYLFFFVMLNSFGS